MNTKKKKIYTERATVAGGCFWCIQGPFDAEDGVSDVKVGYSGSTEKNADYYTVASGSTQHRESVDMQFDPEIISYRNILEIFMRQIDPTDPGGQFADRGNAYKTAIFYHTDEQKQIAEEIIAELNTSKKFDIPIVIEILPFTSFYAADESHQSYYKKHPLRYKIYKKGSGRSEYIKKTWRK